MSSVHEADHADCLMTEREAAAFLGFSTRSLQNWRLRGGGPPFVRAGGRSVRYRRRDLNAWANGQLRTSTSDEV